MPAKTDQTADLCFSVLQHGGELSSTEVWGRVIPVTKRGDKSPSPADIYRTLMDDPRVEHRHGPSGLTLFKAKE